MTALNKELIELILTIDVMLVHLERDIQDPMVCAILLTVRVLFAEYFAKHLTDEAKAYLTDKGVAQPDEIKAKLPQIRAKVTEVLEQCMGPEATSSFYISFSKGKIIFNPEETPNA